jgi:DNA-binding response OmpR family regulator
VDKILGLEVGADDYVTKPFHLRELVARVRAVLRRIDARTVNAQAETFHYKDLVVDYNAYKVTLSGEVIDLGPTEIKLLLFFSRHPGRVYSRSQLLDSVWGDEAFVETRTVDVHVSRLRSAIEKDKDNPQYIFTVRGIGYRFADVP